MHITLRFAGDIDGRTADDFADQLADIGAAPFPVSIVGAGAFGGRDPRVLWAGVAPSPQLEALYRANERAARAAGLEADPRGFKPHVTLARMRGVRQSAVAQFLGEFGDLRHGAVHGHALRAAVGPARIGRSALWDRGGVSVPRCGCDPSSRGARLTSRLRHSRSTFGRVAQRAPRHDARCCDSPPSPDIKQPNDGACEFAAGESPEPVGRHACGCGQQNL